MCKNNVMERRMTDFGFTFGALKKDSDISNLSVRFLNGGIRKMKPEEKEKLIEELEEIIRLAKEREERGEDMDDAESESRRNMFAKIKKWWYS